MTSEPTEELVEHVDVDGSVIEVVTRAQVRADTLRHRCTYIFVVRPNGRLVVHRRAEWKSIYPGWWDVCFGGICGVGEAWLPAAERELAEEAGVIGETLHEIGGVEYEADDGRVLGRAYAVVTEANLTPVDGEVIEIDEIEWNDLDAWLSDRLVCRDSKESVLPLLTADGVLTGLIGRL